MSTPTAAVGGLILMGSAALALIIANSPWQALYFGALQSYVGPLSVQHWINDALMALFFLVVGLEIKRELLQGELSSTRRRILPGLSALGGMIVPALIFTAFNWSDAATSRGWAIPAATDIAFALGVLALLGDRVPASLRIFLTALAIIDDLGAVVIIALFYTANLALLQLALAALAFAALLGLNRYGVSRLWPYLVLGIALWFFVLQSGVHATIAGVLLAFAIPIRQPASAPDRAASPSPLHRLEHALIGWVSFLVVPVFGFANAGVSFKEVDTSTLTAPLTLGVGVGLILGKLIGVFGFAMAAVTFGWAPLPHGAKRVQLLGVSVLCGIGFTMSLFIGMLAFAGDPILQDRVKIGILIGSVLAGVVGWTILRLAPRSRH